MRRAEIERKTKETDVSLTLDLDGGDYKIETDCGFFNHMLELFGAHSGFGLEVKCKGDTQVDFHHTVEDVGIVLGQAFFKAIGDKRGISGRGVLNYQLNIPSAKVYDGDAVEKQKAVGLFDTELIEEFFLSFVREAKITLHIVQLYGKNTHHIIECAFKAVARALKTAVAITGNAIPSSKGIL